MQVEGVVGREPKLGRQGEKLARRRIIDDTDRKEHQLVEYFGRLRLADGPQDLLP